MHIHCPRSIGQLLALSPCPPYGTLCFVPKRFVYRVTGLIVAALTPSRCRGAPRAPLHCARPAPCRELGLTVGALGAPCINEVEEYSVMLAGFRLGHLHHKLLPPCAPPRREPTPDKVHELDCFCLVHFARSDQSKNPFCRGVWVAPRVDCSCNLRHCFLAIGVLSSPPRFDRLLHELSTRSSVWCSICSRPLHRAPFLSFDPSTCRVISPYLPCTTLQIPFNA